MKKIFLMSIVALGGYNLINAQKSTELDFKTPMPPESYQFKKRLINNVSLYTGQPSISIPIYTINLDGLEVPISISYNTGGIKTDEDATFVGLGWSLNIGGEINRTNHGALDENYLISTPYNFHSNGSAGIGFLKTPPNVTGLGNGAEYSAGYCAAGINSQVADYLNFYTNAYNSSDPLGPYEDFDARPDEFFYSMPNHSGKIMFSQKNSRFVTIPFDDIKTEYTVSAVQNGNYSKKNLDFNFTLPDGFKINFGREGMKSMYKLMTGGKLFDQTWQISSITSPKGNSISYIYQPIEYQLCTNLYPVSSQIKFTGITTSTSISCSEVSNKDNLPKTILFPKGKIQFNYDERLDLMPGSKKLKEIVIYNSTGGLIKTIKLNQTYFDANYDVFSGSPNASNIDVANKRLKLNSIRMINGVNSNTDSDEVYTFDYYQSNKIPSKTTLGRDHWGYFNGSAFGSYSSVSSFNPKMKNIDNNYSQTFSLKSIQFPEGGKKEFIYESHRAIPHDRIRRYYDDITDDGYLITDVNLFVSGYDLLSYYPEPTNIQISNFPPNHKVIAGNEFQITDEDRSLSSNDISLQVSSNLPFKVPDYQNINSDYNYVAFQIQKKSGNDFVLFRDLGKISKSENINGINSNIKVNDPTDLYPLNTGTYRLVMVVYQPTVNMSNNISIGHSSYVNIKYRKRVSDEVRIGGLRIKQINTYTNAADISPNYTSQYEYTLDDGVKSSGKVMNAPDYYEFIHYKIPASQPAGQQGTPEMHRLTTKKSTDALTPLYKTSGSNVGYTKVTKKEINQIDNNEIKETAYFSFQDPYYSEIPSLSLSRQQEPQNWQRGKPLKTQYFKNNQVVKEDFFEYNGEAIETVMDEVDEITTDLLDYTEFYCGNELKQSKHQDLIHTYPANFDGSTMSTFNTYNPTGHISGTTIPYLKIYSGFDRIKTKITRDYYNIPVLTTQEIYSYYNDIYRQLEKQNTIFADNSNLEKSFKYASQTGNQLLIDKNMIGIPLETTTTQTIGGVTKTLGKTETIYPTALPTSQTGTLVLPLSVKSYDLQNTPTTDITYDKYDDKGNLLQYTGKDGVSTTIIWGYNQTQPIAKITGAKLSDISQSLIDSIVSASTADNAAAPGSDESAFLSALDNFRKDSSMANYQVTTYSYDPLIGVRSITPPSGIREVYIYDAANRLKEIREDNQSGKLLKEFKYNYKN
ncbi:hypothetical protein [uncultured Chryseobacterium sp.]|uniref:hypothetical protein n=1 Tax=uncultured Chryseobacterium sp. TaxID=259322 RepID=UPI0025FCB68E|nr:hypothetical protein [uncultured Chryseobacterium sp.]